LTNPQPRTCTDWSTYKEPAKSYILAFTGDRQYFLQKKKEPSLRNVSVDRHTPTPTRVRVWWYCDRPPHFEYVRRTPTTHE
jgi:hypothetical protein